MLREPWAFNRRGESKGTQGFLLRFELFERFSSGKKNVVFGGAKGVG